MHTILITGASRGLGLELTRQYAHDGWEVIACCRNPHKASELKALEKQFPGKLEIVELDACNHQQIEALASSLKHKAIDILINNAGLFGSEQNLAGIDYVDWEKVFKVNTIAPLKMAETFLNNLLLGKNKIIVNMSSKMGSLDDNTSGGYYIYRSSKAALNMVTKSLSVDLKPKEVIVINMHPGWVQTDMGGPSALITAEQSITSMRKTINGLTMSDSGKFITYDGKEIAW